MQNRNCLVSRRLPVTLTQQPRIKNAKQKLFCFTRGESASMIFGSRRFRGAWASSEVSSNERDRVGGLDFCRPQARKEVREGGRGGQAYAMVVHKEQGANGGGGEQPKNSHKSLFTLGRPLPAPALQPLSPSSAAAATSSSSPSPSPPAPSFIVVITCLPPPPPADIFLQRLATTQLPP